jgi:hypothetical protein
MAILCQRATNNPDILPRRPINRFQIRIRNGSRVEVRGPLLAGFVGKQMKDALRYAAIAQAARLPSSRY